MFAGRYCRYYSSNQDCMIHRELGTQSIDAFAIDRLHDAASPDQLDALAFQFLTISRRVKTAGIAASAKIWKNYWRQATKMAAAARARIAEIPTISSAPELYNPRTPGKPGCLDSDFNLPFRARIVIGDLEIDGVFTGTYSARLLDGDVIEIGTSRHGKTWINFDGIDRRFEIPTSTLRGLQQLGRLIPLERVQINQAA